MSDSPKEQMLSLIAKAYENGVRDAIRNEDKTYPLMAPVGYTHLEQQARDFSEQIETGGIVRAALASCDGCAEGQTPTISAAHNIWVHNRNEKFGGGMRVAEEIRCEAPNVWTYLALRAKKRVEAKKGGG